MTQMELAPRDRSICPPARPRHAWADNLKVVLVAGVIVGHATMSWTGVGTWVVYEPPVREPLLSLLAIMTLVGGLVAMPLFFFIAGLFTPASLERKGPRRFLADRYLRLGLPIVVFVLLLTPVIEFVDADNAGWDRGFLAFVPTQWWPWPPAWGPLWFLAVLLLFSTAFTVVRSVWAPRARAAARPPRAWQLVAAAVTVMVASYVIRIELPAGDEWRHLALGQAPAWVTSFTLGALAAERRWLDPAATPFARVVRHTAWTAVTGLIIVTVVAGSLGADFEAFMGHGTWESLMVTAFEGAMVVSVPLWVADVFRRRWDHAGPLWQTLGRAAFATFILHQLVLLGVVLLSRFVSWPQELEYALTSFVAVLATYGVAVFVVRLPGVSRIV